MRQPEQRADPPAAWEQALPFERQQLSAMPGPIGWTIITIRDQVRKYRAARRQRQVGSDGSDHASGQAGPPPAGAANGKAAIADPQPGLDGMDSVPLDEEGFGKAGDPQVTGIPRDPANARSKRLSTAAVMAMGFGLAIDFTMCLMSIQPAYYILRPPTFNIVQGPDALYGFVFGSYDLAAMLFAPLFGLLTDRSRRFKLELQLGAAVNSLGNLLYAFIMLADRWWVMLIARFVAGIGEATLGVGSSYITQTTTSARRQVVLGRYRVSQNVARMLGPFVGYMFLGLPTVNSGSSTALKLFNWYTVPGWTAFAVVVLLMTFFAFAFVDPTENNEHRVKPEAGRSDSMGPPAPERVRRFRTFALSWLLLSYFSVFAASAFTVNLFGLFAGQYHQVTSQTENWKTYTAVGVGALVAGIVFRRMIRWAPHWWEERKLSLSTNWLIFVVWMLVIPYGGPTWVPPPALFYAASGLAGFLVVINATSIETVFSKKVSQYGDVVGDNVGKWMSAYFMAAAGGRFSGPLVAAAVTRIATPSGETNYCTDPSVGSDGGLVCNGPPDQQCAITADTYYVGGCVLYNLLPFSIAMAALQLAINLGFAYVLNKNWSWDNPDLALPEAAAAGKEEASASADKGADLAPPEPGAEKDAANEAALPAGTAARE